ncbi:sensor histidine kinase [Candidatus Soleaferrea massiliensis]|uniref:sensor histidine kinase n=1 Tax=Candidatus Soleaferrea massiliensis TaxID=1470354 RepID=UPI00058C47E9|nr:HAMP domain-containing sensor histidine kinase [Candidatus Soleaferrea massiliensis]
MIYKLRKKFIRICILSFIAVFVVLFISIFLVTTVQTNQSLDMLADIVSSNDGTFPEWNEFSNAPNPPPIPNGLNIESPFTTRFFTVRFDRNGNVLSVDVQAIASVSQDEAIVYAEKALEHPKERGWVGDFRYKRYDTAAGQAVVFINGLNTKQSNQQFMLAASLVFAASSIVIIILVILISRKAVKPVAESYEKQKQFITDANHELKTPLTLIRTNLDIMEAEIGANEWLTDIREEAKIMTGLVNRLVSLARMDEDNTKLSKEPFSLSEAVLDTVSAFTQHINTQHKELLTDIPDDINYHGNEAAIRQLISILMDNAVKYCDPGGVIRVTLRGGKYPTILVDNSYTVAGSMELDRLFDRFYRADKARTYGGGFGIGLSIAKAIAEKHHGGEIRAFSLGDDMIRFQVSL